MVDKIEEIISSLQKTIERMPPEYIGEFLQFVEERAIREGNKLALEVIQAYVDRGL